MSRRNSLRLSNYNYSSPGMYFVTMVAQDRCCLFGTISDAQMHLSESGQMVRTSWEELPIYYPHIGLDVVSVMPNHLHGIIVLTGKADSRGVENEPSLADVIRTFKGLTTTRYADGVRTRGWRRFRDRLWQRNYYDHVVRGDEDLRRIREYVVNNPLKWAIDTENPDRLL